MILELEKASKVNELIEGLFTNTNIIDEISKALEIDENVKITGLIFETKNYDKFETLEGNRETNKTNIEKIKESIKERGYKKGQPIIIDKNAKIIDGQHREKACEELEKPIIFTIEDSNQDSLELTQSLNINQKNWGMHDYIQSYADRGNENYKNLLELVKDEKITESLAIWFLFKSRNGNVQSTIKEGNLNCTLNDVLQIKKILAKIREIQNTIPSNLSSEKVLKKAFLGDKVAVPLMAIMSETNYKHSRMVKQIEQLYRSIDIRNMTSAGDSLVEIYNKNLGRNSMNKLRPYSEIGTKLK